MTETDQASNDKLICEIYRSPKEDGMYLYVLKDKGLAEVPEELLQRFGRPQQAMVLLLTPGRKLARASVGSVMASLRERGYYLQLPPRPEADFDRTQISEHNTKLSH